MYNKVVYFKNLGEIKAVTFDIDGTLYREHKLNFRIIPHFLRHIVFFSKYGIARKELRKVDYYPDFEKAQAEIMSKKLKCSPEKAIEKLNHIVYTGLKKYFPRFNACKGVKELIQKLKQNGIKIAVLSDFPPEQKGDIWGIKDYCDVVLGSEEIGALKPSPYVFTTLAKKLNTPAEEILYVGNHHGYDVIGPKKAGMKAAWFISPLKGWFNKKSKNADFTFYHYNQLEKYLFDNNL